MTNLYELAAAVSQGSDPDVRKCNCKGSGWILTDVDVFIECSTHRGRLHPEIEAGRFPTLRVFNRKGSPVQVRGETVPCRYGIVSRAKEDARRIQDMVRRYGWLVSLRYEVVQGEAPLVAPVVGAVEMIEDVLDGDAGRARWGMD